MKSQNFSVFVLIKLDKITCELKTKLICQNNSFSGFKFKNTQ